MVKFVVLNKFTQVFLSVFFLNKAKQLIVRDSFSAIDSNCPRKMVTVSHIYVSPLYFC